MYDLISLQSQAQITREKFTGRYDAIAEEATIAGIDFELVSESGAEASPSPTPESSRQATAEVPVKILIHTQFLGNIAQENTFPLVKET
ncbi:MAG TPA: hypothetical protein VNL15_02340, partial [Dehalococcoidia bacterium]|nr:hypothetical protein [Dehalococcoidia bacterium]